MRKYLSVWSALSSVFDREYLFWTLVGLLLVLTLSSPERVPQHPALVDRPTIAALLGLLIVTKGVEVIGALHGLAHRVLAHLRSQRAPSTSLTDGVEASTFVEMSTFSPAIAILAI